MTDQAFSGQRTTGTQLDKRDFLNGSQLDRPCTFPWFHAVLKNRIHEYFEKKGIRSTGNFRLYSKALFLAVGFIALYVHLVFFTPAPVWAIVECVLLSLFTAAIGFNIMHDGAHGSFSSRGWVNTIAASALLSLFLVL